MNGPMHVLLAASEGAVPAASANGAKTLDSAVAALATYDSGSSRGALVPIDEAVAAAAAGTATAREQLERRLIAVLSGKAPAVAKDYVCRKLLMIGSAACVPPLAGLLGDKEVAHMARTALEAMPCPEAVAALRNSLATLSGVLKVAVIDSLGARRDRESTSVLAQLLADPDARVVSSAAAALGNIGTSEAARLLREFKAPPATRPAWADACLVCAERLLAGGDKAAAMSVYRQLSAGDQPKHVKLAATRGLLLVAQKS